MILEIKPIFHALCRSKVGAILLLIQIAITTAIVSNAAFIIQDRVTYLNQETGYPEDEILAFHLRPYFPLLRNPIPHEATNNYQEETLFPQS